MTAITILACLALALLQITPPADATPLTRVDLATYGGLVVAIVGIIGTLKKLFANWMPGKESMLALATSIVLGSAVKFAGLFPGNDAKSWIYHLVALITVVAPAAGVFHDKVTNTMAGKSDGATPPAGTTLDATITIPKVTTPLTQTVPPPHEVIGGPPI